MNNANITMVAFHGENKPKPLKELILSLSTQLSYLLGSEFKEVFTSFSIYQIHATVIGMEADLINGDLYGHWFRENRGEKQRLNINLFSGLLKRFVSNNCPFTVRFGGYTEAYCTCTEEKFGHWECVTSDTEFHSCGRSAYEGSFYGFLPGPAVITGWPVTLRSTKKGFPHSLYSFRKDCEKAGFLDKYHSNDHPCWMDDDCYIKIGYFNKKAENLSGVIKGVRKYLSKQKPVIIDIKADDITLILYKERTLGKDAIIEKVPLQEIVKEPGILSRLFDHLREIVTGDTDV